MHLASSSLSPAPLAYTGDVAWRPITAVEVEPFPTRAREVWSEEERLELITYVAWNPDAGHVIPGTGGLRKIRWTRAGTGQRRGVRVIYYFHDESMPLFLLTVYPKSRRTDLTRRQLRAAASMTAELKAIYEQQNQELREAPARLGRRRSP